LSESDAFRGRAAAKRGIRREAAGTGNRRFGVASRLDGQSFFGGPPPARLGSRAFQRWERLVGVSAAARRLEDAIARTSAMDSTVLITGETGCGKDEIARALHAASPRADRPFVAVNCGAVAPSLIESQLFGHEKGAFTGAFGASRGVFRAADGGVVFLDEIGEMPLDLQPRLLRVLQEREVTPVGSTDVHHVDVQIVTATNRDLFAAVSRGAFREDLYFRLNTLEIEVPPLRERIDDIPLFVSHFCRHFAAKLGVPPWEPDGETLARFMRYRWPGNVRQLAQTIERGYALGCVPPLPDEDGGAVAGPAALATSGDEPPLPVLNLDALRLMAVRQAMALTGGHKGQAASLLGVHLNTMTRLVEEALPGASQRRKPKAK
jgi:DNA-binding NtrC family response regulator